MNLDRIIMRGNRSLSINVLRSGQLDTGSVVRCADGFRMSVVAGGGVYCTPRPAPSGSASRDYRGPYTAVEVGYPSQRPEPWDQWIGWCEDPDTPTDTVYGHVPVEAVRALVALHGGEVEAAER